MLSVARQAMSAAPGLRGFLGVYQGWQATALRDSPGYAIYFGAYELTISHLSTAWGRPRADPAVVRVTSPACCPPAEAWWIGLLLALLPSPPPSPMLFATVATAAAPAAHPLAVLPFCGCVTDLRGTSSPLRLSLPLSASLSDACVPSVGVPPGQVLLAGGLAGVASWLPIYPFDVLKSRMQTAEALASDVPRRASLSMSSIIRQGVAQEGGYRWLFRVRAHSWHLPKCVALSPTL